MNNTNCVLCGNIGTEHFGLQIHGCPYCAYNFGSKIDRIVDKLFIKILREGKLKKYGIYVTKNNGKLTYHI